MRNPIPIPVPGIGHILTATLRDGVVYASRSDGEATIVWRANADGWEREGIIDFNNPLVDFEALLRKMLNHKIGGEHLSELVVDIDGKRLNIEIMITHIDGVQVGRMWGPGDQRIHIDDKSNGKLL